MDIVNPGSNAGTVCSGDLIGSVLVNRDPSGVLVLDQVSGKLSPLLLREVQALDVQLVEVSFREPRHASEANTLAIIRHLFRRINTRLSPSFDFHFNLSQYFRGFLD